MARALPVLKRSTTMNSIVLHALQADYRAARSGLALLDQRRVVVGTIESLQRFHVGKFEDDDTFRAPGAFEGLRIAAAHDVLPAVFLDERRDGVTILNVFRLIFDLDVGDDVCFHAGL